ncbi:hypothetical protein [Methylopila sp. M107]|uniref:hypothetical protein n=1 Tax=Methylopila sp. M107 TaxID=1101190 RepID=UPI00037DCEBB|nr:hypothetical protein [Methylopila sp. M107]
MTATAIVPSDRSFGSSARGATRTAFDAISGAAAVVAGSVKSAVVRTGEIAGAGVYRGSYGLSYGVVFSGVFVKELLPNGNALRRGFEDGSEAAFDAVEARKPSPRAQAKTTRLTQPKTTRKSAS